MLVLVLVDEGDGRVSAGLGLGFGRKAPTPAIAPSCAGCSRPKVSRSRAFPQLRERLLILHSAISHTHAMLRYVTRPTTTRPLVLPSVKRGLAAKRPSADVDEAAVDAARKWLAKLDPETIPRSICDISFSRSSGPGGQNVNKCVEIKTLHQLHQEAK